MFYLISYFLTLSQNTGFFSTSSVGVGEVDSGLHISGVQIVGSQSKVYHVCTLFQEALRVLRLGPLGKVIFHQYHTTYYRGCEGGAGEYHGRNFRAPCPSVGRTILAHTYSLSRRQRSVNVVENVVENGAHAAPGSHLPR